MATESFLFRKWLARDAAADAPISRGFFRTVPILLTSLVSRITKTSVTASLVF